MKNPKIPEATVVRLSIYSRYLARLEQQGVPTVSSGEIAQAVGVSAAQVRKDLAYFGEFGTRGVGYGVKTLNAQILKILGLSTPWSVVVVGVGNLGSALASYRGFARRGFLIRALFDRDPAKVGRILNGLPVYGLERLPEVVRQVGASIGVICVPADQAQPVADLLVAAGIRGILNFAPQYISVPEPVLVRNVDLSVHLEVLSFGLVRRAEGERPGLAAAGNRPEE
ncbi:MAG: redox-sensing transcriptional repressor Rex [Clostridia bacterium]|jgi:redox-sensing transcriptional repressor|nr:redox-sensing transcriptional repressor Rex [Clostridia bacterium]